MEDLHIFTRANYLMTIHLPQDCHAPYSGVQTTAISPTMENILQPTLFPGGLKEYKDTVVDLFTAEHIKWQLAEIPPNQLALNSNEVLKTSMKLAEDILQKAYGTSLIL